MKVIRYLTSIFSVHFGPLWYMVVPVIVVVIFLPSLYYWYIGVIDFNEAKFTEEWVKISTNITFVYIIVSMLAKRYSFENSTRRRIEILEKFYIHPLINFVKLIERVSTQNDNSVAKEQNRIKIIALWDQLQAIITIQRSNQGGDLNLSINIEELLKSYRFDECCRIVDQLYRTSHQISNDSKDRQKKLVSLTKGLLQGFISSRQNVRNYSN
jgi:hypothetical protein